MERSKLGNLIKLNNFMIMFYFKIPILFTLASILLLSACSQNDDEVITQQKKELLIYCGITMIQPMQEIAAFIEKKHAVKITFTKGGSGSLYRSLQASQVGDLYLPGAESYIDTAKKAGYISQHQLVGYNQAAFIVAKNNPKKFNHELAQLTHESINVVIGSPDSGSIGRETKKILEQAAIYKEVLANSIYVTTDSKDLTRIIKNKKADIAINWRATAFWDENKALLTSLPIKEDFAQKKKLILGVLTFSKYPTISQDFLTYASSPTGLAIFKKHGF